MHIYVRAQGGVADPAYVTFLPERPMTFRPRPFGRRRLLRWGRLSTASRDVPPCSVPNSGRVTRSLSLSLRLPQAPPRDPVRSGNAAYWVVIKTAVADLEITDEEIDYAVRERTRIGLDMDQIPYVHAKSFASVTSNFVEDQLLRPARKTQTTSLASLCSCPNYGKRVS